MFIINFIFNASAESLYFHYDEGKFSWQTYFFIISQRDHTKNTHEVIDDEITPEFSDNFLTPRSTAFNLSNSSANSWSSAIK